LRAYSADGDVSRRESSSEHRFHTLVAEHATAIMRLIIASCSRTTLQQAWQEFTFGHGGKFAGDDLNSELFYSWLRHRWFPRRGTRAARSLCGQSPTRAFLARASTSVDPLLRRYLNACLATPCGFHEILDCTPHRSFVARNVLTETELEVKDALASVSLREGDLLYAHIVPLGDAAVLEAIAPFSFPADWKALLLERCARRELHEPQESPLRHIYFELCESWQLNYPCIVAGMAREKAS